MLHKPGKKLLSLFLTLGILMGTILGSTTAYAADPQVYDFSIDEGNITIETRNDGIPGWKISYGNNTTRYIGNPPAGSSILIFQRSADSTANRVTVKDVTVNIIIDKVNINSPQGSALELDNAKMNLTLVGDNILKNTDGQPGLKVSADSELTVTAADNNQKLTVETGHDEYLRAAAIGSAEGEACGKITIEKGTIVAMGGKYASGIGSGTFGKGHGEIKITGGDVTAAAAHGGSVGIGRGASDSGTGRIVIEGGMVRATGHVSLGVYNTTSGMEIIITGGSIDARDGDGTHLIVPTNGTTPVYLNTLTVGIPQIANGSPISQVDVDGIDNAYGSNDMVTKDGGRIYLWLPEAQSPQANVTAATDGNAYKAAYARGSAVLSQSLRGSTSLSLPGGDSHDFGTQEVGSLDPTQKEVSITNAGTQDIAGLTAVLSGGTGSGFSLEVPQSSTLLAGTTTFFSVAPKPGLLEGVYEDTVVLSGSYMESKSFPVSFKVVTNTAAPVLVTQPQDLRVVQEEDVTLSVAAHVPADGGVLSYQWFQSHDEGSSWEALEGATGSVLHPDTSVTGEFLYRAEVTNTNEAASGTKTAAVESRGAKVTVAERTPQASIHYTKEVLQGLAEHALYLINGDEVIADGAGNIPINSTWPGTSLSVIKPGPTADTASAPQALAIPNRPVVPASVRGENETIKGRGDGRILGVSADMVYSADNGESWSSCPGSELTGLAPGDYLVRYPATDRSFKSEAVRITISPGGDEAVNIFLLTFETNGGTIIDPLQKTGDTSVDLSAYKTSRNGYQFKGWYSNQELTDKVTKVILTGDTTVYAKWEKSNASNSDNPGESKQKSISSNSDNSGESKQKSISSNSDNSEETRQKAVKTGDTLGSQAATCLFILSCALLIVLKVKKPSA